MKELEVITKQFVAAYNKHGATEVTSFFARDAEVGERSGDQHIGTDEMLTALSVSWEVSEPVNDAHEYKSNKLHHQKIKEKP